MTSGASPQVAFPFSTLTEAVVSGVVLTQAMSFKASSFWKVFLEQKQSDNFAGFG
jgi:hypothetical protein